MINNYPDPKCFPNEESHLLFDIGYGYALMFKVRQLLTEVAKALPSGQALLRIEVEEMLEGIEDFNKGRLNSIDRIYAVVGESLKLAEAIGSASIQVKPPPE